MHLSHTLVSQASRTTYVQIAQERAERVRLLAQARDARQGERTAARYSLASAMSDRLEPVMVGIGKLMEHLRAEARG